MAVKEETGKQGIYVHIPFCRAKCGYCDFNSYAGMDELMQPYAAAVCEEMKNFGGAADTIYFGGGTPTLLPLDAMQRILDAAADRFQLAPDTEVTLEANPATFDKERAAAYRCMGFGRMSIGVQSFSDTLLKRLGRLHTAQEAVRAVEAAAHAGFDNLSIDLMYALPGQTPQQFRQDLERAGELPLTHISAYGLKVEEGTPFARQEIQVDEEDYAREYEDLCTSMAQMGFIQYEVSNFARPGLASKHNLKYWTRAPYVGLGAGAHSFDGAARRWENRSDVREYLEAADKRAQIQELNAQDCLVEELIMGMRLTQGVPQELFGCFPAGEEKARRYLQGGFLRRTEKGRLAFTTQGFLVSNTILASFLP